MAHSSGFERIPDSKLERLGRTTVKQYKQQVEERYTSALLPHEQEQGWRILVIPERTIVFWEQVPANLRWIANVGTVRDGHRRYYGVYAGNKTLAYLSPNSGRPANTGKGYWRTYQFRLEQETFEQASKLVPPPKGKGGRSDWLRFFILKGAEALSAGSPWTEMQIPQAARKTLTERLETVRVTSEQEGAIERWRNGITDYELIKRLFVLGVAYLRPTQD
jgi:hypothetical protein